MADSCYGSTVDMLDVDACQREMLMAMLPFGIATLVTHERD